MTQGFVSPPLCLYNLKRCQIQFVSLTVIDRRLDSDVRLQDEGPCNVDVLDGSSLSYQQFIERFVCHFSSYESCCVVDFMLLLLCVTCVSVTLTSSADAVLLWFVDTPSVDQSSSEL